MRHGDNGSEHASHLTSRLRLTRPRGIACLVFVLVLLAVAGSLRRQDAGAQSIEVHSGTFSYVRVQNDLMATACAYAGLSTVSGTLQFRLDRTTNEIAGSLEGAGAIGYQDGDWQSQSNGDPVSWTT